MLSKIKNKIKEFEHRIDINYQFNHDQLAMTQLLKMFDNNVFLPLTTWSVSPKEVLHICNDIVINNRTNIIEFGSGFSTICIAQLLKINDNKANFISIESSVEWAAEINKNLMRLGLDEYVNIIVAPITGVKPEFAKQNQKKWYDMSILDKALLEIETFDLVIVDGPYGGLTPYARYSAIPYLKEKINENYSVFLDDTSRKMEAEIVTDWSQILSGTSTNYKRYTCLCSSSSFGSIPYGNK